MRRPPAALAVAAVIAAAATLVGASLFVQSPDVVDHVTIVNRTGEDLDVDLVDGGGLIALAVATPGAETRVDEVIDEGDRWVFEVGRAGHTLGRIRVTRDRLAAGGWRVVIPESLGG